MNYPRFNVLGNQSDVPIGNIGDNRMVQGLGFPLIPVSQGSDTPYAGPGTVLRAANLADQTPAGLNVPLQLTFGAAQGGPADAVQLSSAGVVTVNRAGVYQVSINMYVQRTTNPGTAVLSFRALVNGVQAGNAVGLQLEDVTQTHFQQVTYTQSLSQGALLTWEMLRDPSGQNDGRLDAFTTVWGASPSALLQILKY